MMGSSVEWRHNSGRLLCNKRRAGISEVAHVLSAGNSFPLCVILFFPPSIFFLPAPALLLIILPTHAHTVPDTCLKGFAHPRQPVSHFTFHPAALLYLSVFFFFSPQYLQDHFPQPGPVSASTPKNKPSVATGRGSAHLRLPRHSL